MVFSACSMTQIFWRSVLDCFNEMRSRISGSERDGNRARNLRMRSQPWRLNEALRWRGPHGRPVLPGGRHISFPINQKHWGIPQLARLDQ